LGGIGRRTLRAKGFDNLPEPVFLIAADGRVIESNAKGKSLLAGLPLEGSHGSIGRRELGELFARAAKRQFSPAPIRVDTLEGARHYEARFAPSGDKGIKTVIFADVTIWKRALIEKDALLCAVRAEREKPVPVCARCGAIRKENGEWDSQSASASRSISRDRLSHGLCPRCLERELGRIGE
jgi:hypothetical protein